MPRTLPPPSLALVLALALGCSSGAKPAAMAPGGVPVIEALDAERLAEVPTLTIRTRAPAASSR